MHEFSMLDVAPKEMIREGLGDTQVHIRAKPFK